jgi:hypothetical protein
MSLQEFGRKIKSKYPQYEQLSDTAIAQKVLAKYPQYKALTRPATPADATTLRAEAEKRRPKNELKPAETGAGPWLANVERDLRGGGGRTAAGRILGKLQGRGERGYSGLDSGVSPGVAEFVGSPVLGVVHAAQGVAETPKHPVRGPLKAAGGVLEAGQIPLAFVGGPVANRAIEAVPSAEHATYLLQSVERDAGSLPVSLSRSGDALLRVKELADRGGTMPQAVRKLLARATEPKGKPLTYSESRDFYSNITRLSAKEKMTLTPVMRRQLGIAAVALKQDVGDAAQMAGRAADYYKGLKEYAAAARLNRAAQEIGKWALRAAGVAGTAELARLVWNATPSKTPSRAPAGVGQ